MIPDLEDSFGNCNVSDVAFLSVTEKQILKNYIESGGSLFIAGSTQNIDLLNDVFGFNLASAGNLSTGFSLKDANEAAGTLYEACPESIPNLNATFLINSSMPSAKRCIYRSGDNAALAFFNVGAGSITYLGYDFNNSGPGCSQAASVWTGCITETSIMVADVGIDKVMVPTLSQWGIINLMLILIIMSVNELKQSRKRLGYA